MVHILVQIVVKFFCTHCGVHSGEHFGAVQNATKREETIAKEDICCTAHEADGHHYKEESVDVMRIINTKLATGPQKYRASYVANVTGEYSLIISVDVNSDLKIASPFLGWIILSGMPSDNTVYLTRRHVLAGRKNDQSNNKMKLLTKLGR